jgi:hypothetical protein
MFWADFGVTLCAESQVAISYERIRVSTGSTQEKCSKAEHGDFGKSAVMEGSKELSDVFQ